MFKKFTWLEIHIVTANFIIFLLEIQNKIEKKSLYSWQKISITVILTMSPFVLKRIINKFVVNKL